MQAVSRSADLRSIVRQMKSAGQQGIGTLSMLSTKEMEAVSKVFSGKTQQGPMEMWG